MKIIFLNQNHISRFLTISLMGQKKCINLLIEHYHTVRLNPIRVSADEFSYPIHVYIRYEIEKEIFNNKIQFKDIHHLWNKYYKQFLDIDITNDTVGVFARYTLV